MGAKANNTVKIANKNLANNCSERKAKAILEDIYIIAMNKKYETNHNTNLKCFK